MKEASSQATVDRNPGVMIAMALLMLLLLLAIGLVLALQSTPSTSDGGVGSAVHVKSARGAGGASNIYEPYRDHYVERANVVVHY